MTTVEMEIPVAARPASSARRLASLGATVVLASLSLLFGLAHVAHWRTTGEPTGLVFALQELVLVAVFVVRRRPLATSDRARDWVMAVVGAYAGLLLRPTGQVVGGLGNVWMGLQLLGTVGAVACITRLGRSFGVVAANRGVRCDGPYRLMRHPMYASYLLGQVGYLLGSFSAVNLAVVVGAFAGQVFRMGAEERVLRRDEAYRRYCERVPHRLIPGVY
jgi:protein-S-isoprenylcysteine O-methyltransferase Ste14